MNLAGTSSELDMAGVITGEINHTSIRLCNHHVILFGVTENDDALLPN